MIMRKIPCTITLCAFMLCLLIMLSTVESQKDGNKVVERIREFHGSKTSYEYRRKKHDHHRCPWAASKQQQQQHQDEQQQKNPKQMMCDVDHESKVHSKLRENCDPVHVYLLARHGTRYPTKKHISKFNSIMPILQHFKNAPDHAKHWKSPFHMRDNGLLAPTGEQELYQLGKNIRSLFPKLFHNVPYHPSIYNFRSSQVVRALQSASSFAYGFFDGKGNLGESKQQPIAIVSESRHLDRHLRFHDSCPTYRLTVKDNDALKEISHYKNFTKAWLPELAEGFFKRWGFEDEGHLESMKLTKEKVLDILWSACRHEASAFNKTVDGICSLFDNENELHILEFIDDLKDYWFKGPGYPINYEMSCILVEEIVSALESAAKSHESTIEDATIAHFRFGHAETLIPLISKLGFYRDHDAMASVHHPESEMFQSRIWRSTVVSPYGSNVAIILYNCTTQVINSNGETESEITQYNVEILHNEIPLRFPDGNHSIFHSCAGSYHCPLKEFAKALRDSIDKEDGLCDFDILCDSKE